MEKIIERNVLDVYLNPDLNIFELVWRDIQEEISEDEFKYCISAVAQKAQVYRVQGYVVDNTNLHFVISPEVQAWHDTEIIPQFVEAGIKQIIFVLNEEELFTTMSVEQTFEQNKAQIIHIQFTNTVEKARSYFVNTKEVLSS